MTSLDCKKRFICLNCYGIIEIRAPYEPMWFCEKCQKWYSEDYLMGREKNE